MAAERVTSTAQARGVDPSYRAHEQEALLLAELLRNTRLSLLYAEAGTDKTEFLKFGLLPMLSRRAADRLVAAPAQPSGVVIPFLDRRSRATAGSSRRRREIVAYVDCSAESPLAALRQALYQAAAADRADWAQANTRLRDILGDLGGRLDAHLIVLLDRYDELTPSSSDESSERFARELAEAINQPRISASFLIALAEDAKPRLEALRRRIPGFDDSSLKLTPERNPAATPAWRPEPAPSAAVGALPVLTETLTVSEGGPSPALRVEESPSRVPAKKKVKRPPPPRVEVKTEDVYAMIEAALSRIAVRAGASWGVDGISSLKR